MAKLRAILGPYPPPYRGVELQAKMEFEASKGRSLFIGTSESPTSSKNLILVKRGSFFKNCPQLFFKILKHRKEISEINAHYLTTFGFIAAVSKFFFGIPYTVTCHGSDVLVNMKKPFYRIFNSIALKNAEKVFVVSKSLGAELIEHGFDHKKIALKPNKINRKIFRDMHLKRKNQILYAGAVQYSKGTDLLLKAFLEIRSRFPKYKLVIAGPETDSGFSRNLRPKNAAVSFVGEKTPEEIAKLMNESKLFVMPSRSEGYGMALAEALACGLKAVSTNAGGLKEAGKNSRKCVFVNPDVDELADAIAKQLSHA